MWLGKPDLPLARHLARGPDARIRLICSLCGSGHDVAAAQAVWFLKAFGLGDELSPVADTARLALNPCVRCGAMAWQAWPCEPLVPPAT